MTTWATGDVLTATWVNSVEKVLAMGTYGATSSPRLTIAPNTTYDLGGNIAAANIVYNGSVSLSGTQQYEGISFRTLTSTHTGTGYSTGINFIHSATVAAGSSAYGIIGQVSGTGAGKINPIYGRAVMSSGFTGVGVAGDFAVTYDTGSTADPNSAIVTLVRDGTNTNAFPIGVLFYTNNAGDKLLDGIVVDNSLMVTGNVLQWNQRTGTVTTTAAFLKQFDSSANTVTQLLGNGQFGTANSVYSFAGTDPANAHYVSIFADTATNYIISGKNGSGVIMPLTVQMNATAVLQIQTDNSLIFGKAGAATNDTTGYHYMQSIAGAATGVPTTQSGYVAFRYDRTNNKIYVYNGAWKSVTLA